jgi:hypothetical protein
MAKKRKKLGHEEPVAPGGYRPKTLREEIQAGMLIEAVGDIDDITASSRAVQDWGRSKKPAGITDSFDEGDEPLK